MKLITEQKWNSYWNKEYKTCFLTHLLYSVPYLDAKYFDKTDVQNEVNKIIIEIKQYLLFFDYVSIPLGSIVKPRNKFALQIGKALFRNPTFLHLVESGLITSSIYQDFSIEDTFNRRKYHLERINWENMTDIYEECIQYELSNFIFYERNVEVDLSFYKEALIKKIENINNPLIREELTQVFKKSDKNPNFSFSRPYFYQEALKLNKKEIDHFLDFMAVDFFRGTEFGDSVIVPYQLDMDKVLRKSLNTGVYAFLYNKDFLQLFLSFYLDEKLISNIRKLSGKNFLELRKEKSWRVFIDNYHDALKIISKSLTIPTTDNIEVDLKDLFYKHFNENSKSKVLDISLFFLAVISSHSRQILKSSKVKERINRSKNNLSLYITDKQTKDFIGNLKEKLKSHK